jgi:hypothetical protein
VVLLKGSFHNRITTLQCADIIETKDICKTRGHSQRVAEIALKPSQINKIARAIDEACTLRIFGDPGPQFRTGLRVGWRKARSVNLSAG